MEGLQIGFQYSGWWLVPLCLLALGLAYWYYQGKNPFPQSWVNPLRVLRAATLIALIVLLLNPLVEWVTSQEEPATVAILWDRSESITLGTPNAKLEELRKQVNQLKNSLKDRGLRVETNLPDSVSNKRAFSFGYSDLNKSLSEASSDFENRNLASVILLTDGIQNRGSSPLYKTYPFQVHTLGLGDTTRRNDVFLAATTANKLAFLGNKFPISAELGHFGFENQSVLVSLFEGESLLEKQNIRLGANGSRQMVNFFVKATSKGLKSYRVKVESGKKEINLRNNENSILVEVIDGKQRILIAAASPHPDIKAIRAALEKNENYEVEFWMAGTGPAPRGNYGLIILHQLPDKQNTPLGPLAALINDDKTPLWVISGAQTYLPTLNEWPLPMKIEGRGMARGQNNTLDKVKGIYEEGFPYFNLAPNEAQLLGRLPLLAAPFGEYKLLPEAKVLLNQALGNVNTGKPLLSVAIINSKRTALLAAEGIWEWRIQEYGDNNSHQTTDGLILKLVQFLATKEDKRKFRFYPIKESFTQSEAVSFEAEAYNALYEKLPNVKVQLTVSGKRGTNSFDFTSDENNSRFELGLLPPGVYNYKANATVNGKNESVQGSFAVKQEDLEAIDLTADHTLLRNLAAQQGGKFFKANNIEDLKEEVLKNPPKGLVRSFEEMADAISLWWLLLLILLLLTTEWTLRKLGGGY